MAHFADSLASKIKRCEAVTVFIDQVQAFPSEGSSQDRFVSLARIFRGFDQIIFESWTNDGPPIGKLLFSDSMLYYMSLNEQEGAVPTIRLHDLLRAAASVFAGGLADGNPARGGLDIGIAANFPRIGIYGPGLYNAYALESKVAQYPRIEQLVCIADDNLQERQKAARRLFERDMLQTSVHNRRRRHTCF